MVYCWFFCTPQRGGSIFLSWHLSFFCLYCYCQSELLIAIEKRFVNWIPEGINYFKNHPDIIESLFRVNSLKRTWTLWKTNWQMKMNFLRMKILFHVYNRLNSNFSISCYLVLFLVLKVPWFLVRTCLWKWFWWTLVILISFVLLKFRMKWLVRFSKYRFPKQDVCIYFVINKSVYNKIKSSVKFMIVKNIDIYI